jgi:hypothetical protein
MNSEMGFFLRSSGGDTAYLGMIREPKSYTRAVLPPAIVDCFVLRPPGPG